jgi:hypothetical protein
MWFKANAINLHILGWFIPTYDIYDLGAGVAENFHSTPNW